jgi:hypothetical protein
MHSLIAVKERSKVSIRIAFSLSPNVILGATSAGQFARRAVELTLRPKPPREAYIGGGAHSNLWLHRLFPRFFTVSHFSSEHSGASCLQKYIGLRFIIYCWVVRSELAEK